MGRIPKAIIEMTLEGVERPTGAELDRIRRDGVGNGFTALNTADGFRQDDTLWFGTCAECGERVSNSWRDGVWEHAISTNHTYHADGSLLSRSTKFVDYCPTQRGEA